MRFVGVPRCAQARRRAPRRQLAPPRLGRRRAEPRGQQWSASAPARKCAPPAGAPDGPRCVCVCVCVCVRARARVRVRDTQQGGRSRASSARRAGRRAPFSVPAPRSGGDIPASTAASPTHLLPPPRSGAQVPGELVVCAAGLAEAPRRPRREAPETAEARRGARPLLNRRGAKYEIYC